MAQYIYTMNRVSKVVPPKRTILRDISLSFFPGAKIGVLGLNGSGKSTLLKIMSGVDKEIEGEARAQAGIKVGYLPQEPLLVLPVTEFPLQVTAQSTPSLLLSPTGVMLKRNVEPTGNVLTVTAVPAPLVMEIAPAVAFAVVLLPQPEKARLSVSRQSAESVSLRAGRIASLRALPGSADNTRSDCAGNLLAAGIDIMTECSLPLRTRIAGRVLGGRPV